MVSISTEASLELAACKCDRQASRASILVCVPCSVQRTPPSASVFHHPFCTLDAAKSPPDKRCVHGDALPLLVADRCCAVNMGLCSAITTVFVLLSLAAFAKGEVQTVELDALSCVSVEHTLAANSNYEIVFENVTGPDQGLLCTQSDIL